MTLKTTKEQGFTVVEGVLLTVIVAMIAGVGYYVYNSQKQIDKTYLQTANSSVAPSAKKPTTKIATSTPVGKPSPVAGGITKAPADSLTPASGVCYPASSSPVSITINPDVADPRCVKVTSAQTLSVTNSTKQEITVSIGGKSLTLSAGATQSISDSFGSYLESGVHNVHASNYGGGSGPEIWLQ
jgi:Tfp pilus assembly protein PilE